MSAYRERPRSTENVKRTPKQRFFPRRYISNPARASQQNTKAVPFWLALRKLLGLGS